MTDKRTIKVHVATIQVMIVDCHTTAQAQDALGEIMYGALGIRDWAYLKMGGQYAYPTEKYVPHPDIYEEGDFLL